MEIRIKNLCYTYQINTPFEKEVLHHIDLTLEPHKWYGIIGQTGSGKSTLIQNMNGLLTPTEGIIHIGNKVLTSNRKKNPPLYEDVGIVFQYPEHQLFEETVAKDIAYGLKNIKYPKEAIQARVREAIIQVGLDEEFLERSPFQLSGGEKRRVAIAGVLAMQPNVLILDEPTAGLDYKGKMAIMKLFQSWINESGGTIIMISHDMDQILANVDEVILMSAGKVLMQEKPVTLFTQYREEISRVGIEIPKIIDFVTELNRKWDNKLTISSNNEEEILQQLAKHIYEKGM